MSLIFGNFDNYGHIQYTKLKIFSQSSLLTIQAFYQAIPCIFTIIIIILFGYEGIIGNPSFSDKKRKFEILGLFILGLALVIKIFYAFFYQTILNWKIELTIGNDFNSKYEALLTLLFYLFGEIAPIIFNLIIIFTDFNQRSLGNEAKSDEKEKSLDEKIADYKKNLIE